jgi:hypothetical protein
MSVEAEIKVSMVGGKSVTLANIDKIFAVSKKPLRGFFSGGVRVEGYFPKYAVVKVRGGYMFKEPRFGLGINGKHKTLRSLVVSTALESGDRFRIVVEGAE